MTINYIYLKQLPIPSSNQFKDADNIIQIVKELLQENKGYYQDLDDLVQGDATILLLEKQKNKIESQLKKYLE